MINMISKLVSRTGSQFVARNQFQRWLSKGKVLHQTGTYEGDGKTKAFILNKELEGSLMINSYNQYGFRLNNDMVILGPMAIFPRSVLSWNVSDYTDINEDSLSLFSALEPKIDILIIGLGDAKLTTHLSHDIIKFIQTYQINVEVLRTDQACGTFNFLNSEKRMVAAALIPPNHIFINENDILKSKIMQNSLFEEKLEPIT